MTGPDEEQLREMLAGFRNRSRVPALGAAVVTRDGRVTLDVIGNRRRGSSEPATTDDQWHIGSCAKAMTAALYAVLVERGVTEWDVPINTFFPELAGDLDTGWSDITIDELLVSRSGMRANLRRTEMLAAWNDDRPMIERRTSSVISALREAPRRRGAFRYSNLGYIVVGAAIDRIADMPFEDAMRVNLLEPLGITSVGFGSPPDIWGHKPRFRTGGILIGRGSPVEPSSTRSDNPGVMTPAGRLHLTLADWSKFQRLFLNHGLDILEPATIEHLLAQPEDKGNGMAMGWASASGLEGASYGMQGSNTLWTATAIIDTDFENAVMLVANDGRTSLLRRSAQLLASIIQSN